MKAMRVSLQRRQTRGCEISPKTSHRPARRRVGPEDDATTHELNLRAPRPGVIGDGGSADLVELDDVDLEVIGDEVLDAPSELPAVGLIHGRYQYDTEAPVAE